MQSEAIVRQERVPVVQPRDQQHPRRLPVIRRWPGWLVGASRACVLLAILALWEGGVATGIIDGFFWSSPSKIAASFWIYLSQGDAPIDILVTFRATLIGFVLGTTLGSILGLSFWWSANYAAVVQPFLVAFESTPKLALAPLIILIFGIGTISKVAIAVALTVVVSCLTTFSGVRALDPDGEKLLYSLGATRRQVFAKFVIPAVLPWAISVLRINIGLALTGAVVGEFISSEHGLGRTILYAGETYDIALVWSSVLLLSALSFLMYLAISWTERMLIKGVTHGITAG